MARRTPDHGAAPKKLQRDGADVLCAATSTQRKPRMPAFTRLRGAITRSLARGPPARLNPLLPRPRVALRPLPRAGPVVEPLAARPITVIPRRTTRGPLKPQQGRLDGRDVGPLSAPYGRIRAALKNRARALLAPLRRPRVRKQNMRAPGFYPPAPRSLKRPPPAL